MDVGGSCHRLYKADRVTGESGGRPPSPLASPSAAVGSFVMTLAYPFERRLPTRRSATVRPPSGRPGPYVVTYLVGVPVRRVRVLPSASVVTPWLDEIRAELHVPESFPIAVEEEAAAAATAGPRVSWSSIEPVDRRELELVTIDPPGSRDLDQAFGAERSAGGFRVHYAIADVAAFVTPGGAIDVEAHHRGVTLYQPDRRTPLHPESLGQGAASLLPDQERQALLWTIDLDRDGRPSSTPRVERSFVRSRRAMTYQEVQTSIDAGTAPEMLELLRTIGQLRERQEIDRGAVSLRLPTQEVVLADGRADLTFEDSLPVEDWNAQISLLTGIVAAGMMLDAGVGILRTLPPPDPRRLQVLRTSAASLGVPWPKELSYPAFVRRLDPSTTVGAVLLHQAARTTQGAAYASFHGASPSSSMHSAIASPYAHVTAPLRRLADRFANEVLLAISADADPPEWALAGLAALPEEMAAAQRREHGLERAIVDVMEALLLEDRVDEEFDATVISTDGKGHDSVQLRDPAIIAPLEQNESPVGSELSARLIEADPRLRSVRFVPATRSGGTSPA